MASAEELILAFQIFSKYTHADYMLHATHDKLSVNVDPNDVSEEDLGKLEEVGFHPDTSGVVNDFTYYT